MTLQGKAQLQRRLRAIGDTSGLMHSAALRLQAEAKRNVPRKTGHLGRSIVIGHVTDTEATVEAQANYARYVEEGTGLYGPRKRKIVPVRAQALHWQGGGSSRVRLSGRSRTRGGTAIAKGVFAKSVRGRKATPFMRPAAEKVARGAGLTVEIIETWNKAA